MADGADLGEIADRYLLHGSQWGVTNELGSWPGQPWLRFCQMWCNVPLWSSSGSDITAVASVVVVPAFFLLVPHIPGVRSLPRLLHLYRLIWRPYYRRYDTSPRS